MTESGKMALVSLGSGKIQTATYNEDGELYSVLFFLDNIEDAVWIPFSVLSTPTKVEVETHGARMQIGRIRVEKWYADKNGLEVVRDVD